MAPPGFPCFYAAGNPSQQVRKDMHPRLDTGGMAARLSGRGVPGSMSIKCQRQTATAASAYSQRLRPWGRTPQRALTSHQPRRRTPRTATQPPAAFPHRSLRCSAAAEDSANGYGKVRSAGRQPGVSTTLVEQYTVGTVTLEAEMQVKEPGVSVGYTMLALKQLHVAQIAAKLKYVIKRASQAEGVEDNPRMVALVERATHGTLTMYSDDYKYLVETLLPSPAVAALGDLDANNSDNPAGLRQLMIDAILQWAAEEDDFKSGFDKIVSSYKPNYTLSSVVDERNQTPNGEVIRHELVIRSEGPAVSILRDQAGNPDFLATLSSGDPYRGLQEHEILQAAAATTFRLVAFTEIDEFRLFMATDSGAAADGTESAKPSPICSGGPELYQLLVSALAEYAESQMANGDGGDCWIPADAAISLMRLSDSEGGPEGRVHMLKVDGSYLDQADKGQQTLHLTIKELLTLLDAVDCMLETCPHLLELSPPSPEPPATLPWWSSLVGGRAPQLAAALLLLGGAAWAMARSSLLSDSSGRLGPAWPRNAEVQPQAASMAAGSSGADEATPWLTPANRSLDAHKVAELCRTVESELEKRAVLAGRPAWQNLGTFTMEYQIVVALDGRVLGSRPVNGIASHFYHAMELGTYNSPLGDIDRSARPVVLKAVITNRLVDGTVSPEVEVRGWEDDDSLRSWGIVPSP